MKITHPGFSKAAIIDTEKKYGEKGQYRLLPASKKNLRNVLERAKKNKHEVRYDYDLIKAAGKKLPFRFIITDIPPDHVQPFHKHKDSHELTIVLDGSVSYIESGELSETASSKSDLRKKEKKLSTGDLVIDDTNRRHTIANFSDSYARMITIQYAKKKGADMIRDWTHNS